MAALSDVPDIRFITKTAFFFIRVVEINYCYKINNFWFLARISTIKNLKIAHFLRKAPFFRFFFVTLQPESNN